MNSGHGSNDRGIVSHYATRIKTLRFPADIRLCGQAPKKKRRHPCMDGGACLRNFLCQRFLEFIPSLLRAGRIVVVAGQRHTGRDTTTHHGCNSQELCGAETEQRGR